MPKISERKVGEMEKLKEKIKTVVRESKPRENYLQYVYEQNKKKEMRRKSTEDKLSEPTEKATVKRNLNNVASHANLGRFRNGSLITDLSAKD
jgi:phosphotransacetylase